MAKDKPHRCSLCGKTGHRAGSCTSAAAKKEKKGAILKKAKARQKAVAFQPSYGGAGESQGLRHDPASHRERELRGKELSLKGIYTRPLKVKYPRHNKG